jgi:Zn finger protein HypA/HybF involved in hydrogenase expression
MFDDCGMPCYRCARVQTDPVKGTSPWARGVVKGEQILVCPICQQEHSEWASELDRCPRCQSSRLSVVMGSVVCRACDFDYPAH